MKIVNFLKKDSKKTFHLTKDRKVDEVSSPAQKNKELNDQEYKLRLQVLKSYPTYVAINLSDVCNVSCKFCRYNFYIPHKRMVTLNDIRRQKWLKYPQTIDLFCGVGESLLNPYFKDIFKYMMEKFPYQYRGLTTNGVLIDNELTSLFLKGANWVHVSVNAFESKTYYDLMRVDRRNAVFEAIETLCKAKTEHGTKLPTITLSYITVRRNIEEFVDFVDHFGAIGVDNIVATHYTTTDLDFTMQRRLPPEESLHNHKKLASDIFSQANEIAKKYPKLTLKLPREAGLKGPFPADLDVFDNTVCTNPWKTAYISTLPVGRWMQFCCTFLVDHRALTAFDFDRPFEEVWNSDFMQWIRQRSSVDNINPSCAFCRSCDLSDPSNNIARKKAIHKAQRLYEEYSGLKNVFGEDF